MNRKYTLEQLMPKRYPANKPESTGTYIFHHIGMDRWFAGHWSGRYFQISPDNSAELARNIDYLIPVRLEEESEEA